MNTTESTFDVRSISSIKVLSLISQLLGGGSSNSDPDNPMPHGPWDPYIRRALKKMGPRPEPWKAVNRFSLAELNPQPLPPKAHIVAALTQEVIDHSLLLFEIADAINQSNEERSIIIVSGKVDQYITDFDELWPPIHPNWDGHISSLEWLIAAAVFEQNALTVSNKNLSRIFHEAGEKLAERGFSKM